MRSTTRLNLRRKRHADSENDTNEIKPWRFLRVMPTSVLQESMQKIPCEFASKFGSTGSTFASLSLPNRQSWATRVTKKNNKLQLCTGWDKFVKDNSLHDGDMMLFKYKGNCKFKVHIFDPVGCERDYNVINTELGNQKIGSCNEKRHGISNVKNEIEEEVDAEDHGRDPCSVIKSPNSKSFPMDLRKKTTTNCVEISSELEAFMLSLKNPFFFAKNNSTRNELLIPSDVVKTFGILFAEMVTLQDPNKRKWEARVVTWKDGRTRLTGWKQFCKYNMVRDKDACVCEFIPSNGATCLAIRVHIFRDQKRPTTLC